jgi:hypothetical protein
MRHNETPSSGALPLPPLHQMMKRKGALTDGSAGCIENTQCAPNGMERSQ